MERVVGPAGLRSRSPRRPRESAAGLGKFAVLTRRRTGGALEGAGERELRVVAGLMGDLPDGGVAVA
jgi:hypothetical protein